MNLFNGNTFTFLIKFFRHSNQAALVFSRVCIRIYTQRVHQMLNRTQPDIEKFLFPIFFRSVFSSCFLYKATAVSRRVEVTEFANILQPNTIKYGKLNFYSLDLIHPRSALELRKGDSNRSNLNIALLASMLLCTHKL